jgi:hypothetical protein
MRAKKLRTMCQTPECGKRARRAGQLCAAHFRKRWEGQTPPPLEKRQRNKGLSCSCSGCSHPAYARGLCQSHTFRYYMAKRNGQLEAGYWKEPIARTKRGSTHTPVTCWCQNKGLTLLSRYAESRGMDLGDAIVELAVAHLNYRSAREFEEERIVTVWNRTDAMEAI